MTEEITGICHECMKEFQLKDEYLIPDHQIWECPHCDYPNDLGDAGVFLK